MARSAALELAAALLSVAQLAVGQNPGNETAEVHPSLTTYKCTTAGGCVAQDTSVVLDWNYRYIHDGSTSCVTSSGVSSTLCPDEATCAQNCVVEGVDYAAAGVSTSGDSLTMYQYLETNGVYNSVSPRLYLLGSDGDYVMMQLNGQELSFDVDLSTLPCGENGALYLSQMDATGGRSQYNTGGANYGSGYCDAQCPVQNWKNGTVNTARSGYCCNEMDILEANSFANAFTPHPCTATACDSSGCGFNPYANGYTSYYGAGDTVDTSKVFTITTQFITSDGTTSGTLLNITRKYIQNGVQLPSAKSGGDTITAAGCSSGMAYGGLTTMGEALEAGMVLAFSIWNDGSGYMNWLDSGGAGPCSSTAGNPATIVANEPNTHVIFSNIRWGDIGSTTGGTTTSSSSSSTSVATSTKTSTSTTLSTKTTTTTSATTSPTCAAVAHYGQCGGIGFTGCTSCATGYTCQQLNPYYYQCL
ncbi:glycoside hydrolase family 7 protein [Xylariales sp. PMI_506]|nr:glycoside hydrolase family 7 protein [Xylariales sp. PMI_506]